MGSTDAFFSRLCKGRLSPITCHDFGLLWPRSQIVGPSTRVRVGMPVCIVTFFVHKHACRPLTADSTPRTTATRARKEIRAEITCCTDVSGILSGRSESWVADKTDWLWVCKRCSIGHGEKQTSLGPRWSPPKASECKRLARAAAGQIICCAHGDRWWLST